MSQGQLLTASTRQQIPYMYFHPGLMDRGYMVEDDHIPFLHRGD